MFWPVFDTGRTAVVGSEYVNFIMFVCLVMIIIIILP